MEEYLQRLDNGVQKYTLRCDEFRKKISDYESQEKGAVSERERLTRTVEEQNLSEVEVHRLTSDRQSLDVNLKRARSEREEKSRRTYDLEIKRSQAYSMIERLVEEYENKAAKLGLIPNPPKGYEHLSFYQELNGSAATPASMVPDCTSTIKPAIGRLKQDTMGVRRAEEERVLSIEEELGDLKDKTRALFEECEEAETRYKALLAELNTAKEVSFSIVSPHSLLTFVAVPEHRDDRCIHRAREIAAAMYGHQDGDVRRHAGCRAALASSSQRTRQAHQRCREAQT